MPTPPHPPEASAVTRRLLAWYPQNRREMDWRNSPTPYRVLLSELMLQQTRVDTVRAYFARFVALWPTFEDLAAASEEQVLEQWAGLGYYSRARNLHRAAQQVVAEGLPSTVAGLRKLPGVGPYTAGAVGSIALGLRTPLVDGNVERVISRIDGREEDPRSTRGSKALWARAEELLPEEPELAGTLNQALMELGALVCSPRSPSCERCPVSDLCAGKALGIHLELPRKAPKKPPTPVSAVAGLLWRDGRVLCGRRPTPGLLGGLWEPVGAWVDAPSEGELARVFRERVGIEVAVQWQLGSVVHVFSHRRLTLLGFAVVQVDAAEPRAASFYTEVRYLDPEDPGVGLSKLAYKTLALHDDQVPLAAAPSLLCTPPSQET